MWHYPPEPFEIEHRGATWRGEREVFGSNCMMTVRSAYGEKTASILGYQHDLRILQTKLLSEIVDQWQGEQR